MWTGPCVAEVSRNRAPLTVIRPLCASNRSTSTSAGCAVAVGADLDAEPLRPGPCYAHAVAGAAQLQVERAARVVLHLGRPPRAVASSRAAADLFLVLVGLDRGGGEGDAGVPVRGKAALAADPVDPAGVRARVDHLGLVEQVEHEALVGGAALDDHGGLGHRAAQPAEGLAAVAAVGDDLRDHRVEVGGDRVALADPGVDADAGAGGQHQPGDAAGRGREVAVRVLGVEPRLDGVARTRRACRLRASRPRPRAAGARPGRCRWSAR